MQQKIDKLYIGVILGIIIPSIFYMIFYYAKIRHLTYFQGSSREFLMIVLPIILTRCIFPNAILFFIFIWRNMFSVAKGLLITTALLTAILVIINFVL